MKAVSQSIYLILIFHFLLYFISIYYVHWCTTQSYPILSFSTKSYLILFLSSFYPILYHAVLFFPILSYPILSYPPLSTPNSTLIVLTHSVLLLCFFIYSWHTPSICPYCLCVQGCNILYWGELSDSTSSTGISGEALLLSYGWAKLISFLSLPLLYSSRSSHLLYSPLSIVLYFSLSSPPLYSSFSASIIFCLLPSPLLYSSTLLFSCTVLFSLFSSPILFFLLLPLSLTFLYISLHILSSFLFFPILISLPFCLTFIFPLLHSSIVYSQNVIFFFQILFGDFSLFFLSSTSSFLSYLFFSFLIIIYFFFHFFFFFFYSLVCFPFFFFFFFFLSSFFSSPCTLTSFFPCLLRPLFYLLPHLSLLLPLLFIRIPRIEPALAFRMLWLHISVYTVVVIVCSLCLHGDWRLSKRQKQRGGV